MLLPIWIIIIPLVHLNRRNADGLLADVMSLRFGCAGCAVASAGRTGGINLEEPDLKGLGDEIWMRFGWDLITNYKFDDDRCGHDLERNLLISIAAATLKWDKGRLRCPRGTATGRHALPARAALGPRG
jgi:hypothetical protein